LVGDFTHKTPPWNSEPIAPDLLWEFSPFWLPSTLTVRRTHLDPMLALGAWLMLIDGVHPSEFVFAVQ
jgi:hypothetical protein